MTRALPFLLVLLGWLAISIARRFGMPAVVGTLAALVTMQYWLGPILIRLTNRQRVPRWDVPIPNDLGGVPEGVRPFFTRTDQAFRELGFSFVSVLKGRDASPGYSAFVTLYVHRSARQRAVAHAHIAHSGPGPVKVKPSFYFVTRFAGDRWVETANSDHVSPFPIVPGKESRQFPEIDDPKLLHRIHQIREAPLGSTARDFPAEGQEVEHLSKGMESFYRTHVGTGYLEPVEPGVYRPTWKGALLMTWRLLPPWKWLLRSRRTRLNQEFLREQHLLAPR